MKLLWRSILQAHSPQHELFHSEYTQVQRPEPQFPTSQGKRPSNLTTETASLPLHGSGAVGSYKADFQQDTAAQRLTLQLRGQTIQLGCGKSTFNSLLTWFKAWSWNWNLSEGQCCYHRGIQTVFSPPLCSKSNDLGYKSLMDQKNE